MWLFGHSLDGAGRRSLFLEDAYIQTVINNPVGAPELSTYKLGSARQRRRHGHERHEIDAVTGGVSARCRRTTRCA